MPSTLQTKRPSARPSGFGLRRRAFTLIELLTAMSIVLIITTITVVSWMEVRRGYEIRMGLSHLQSTLSLARQMAIFKQNRVGVYFVSPRYYIVSNLTLRCNASEGGTNVLSKGVELQNYPAQGIIFDSKGYIEAGNGIVKISELKPTGSTRLLRYAEITVNKVGMTKVKTGTQ